MIRPVQSRRAAGSTHLRCSQKFPWLVCTRSGRWERRAAAGLPPAAPQEEDEESVSGGQGERGEPGSRGMDAEGQVLRRGLGGRPRTKQMSPRL